MIPTPAQLKTKVDSAEAIKIVDNLLIAELLKLEQDKHTNENWLELTIPSKFLLLIAEHTEEIVTRYITLGWCLNFNFPQNQPSVEATITFILSTQYVHIEKIDPCEIDGCHVYNFLVRKFYKKEYLEIMNALKDEQEKKLTSNIPNIDTWTEIELPPTLGSSDNLENETPQSGWQKTVYSFSCIKNIQKIEIKYRPYFIYWLKTTMTNLGWFLIVKKRTNDTKFTIMCKTYSADPIANNICLSTDEFHINFALAIYIKLIEKNANTYFAKEIDPSVEEHLIYCNEVFYLGPTHNSTTILDRFKTLVENHFKTYGWKVKLEHEIHGRFQSQGIDVTNVPSVKIYLYY